MLAVRKFRKKRWETGRERVSGGFTAGNLISQLAVIGHNRPVKVVIQFPQAKRPPALLNVRITAINLTPALLRLGHQRTVKMG